MRAIRKIKIVIAGPFAAGKTQFINTVSEIKTVSTERRTQQLSEKSVKGDTTVAMDFGKIRIDDDMSCIFLEHLDSFDLTSCGRF